MAEELFPKKTPAAGPVAAGMADVAARLKVLEERYANLVRREQLSEQNLLQFEKDLRSELRALQKRLLETRKHLTTIQERLDTVQGQIGSSVQRHELRVLDAYIDMWQPASFLTREEARKMIEAAKIELAARSNSEKQ